MITIALFALLNSTPIETPCERAALLNGNVVTTCGGRVASVRDSLGNIREYALDGSIIVRSDGAVPTVLER